MSNYFRFVKESFVLPLIIFVVFCVGLVWVELKTSDKMKRIMVINLNAPVAEDYRAFYKRQFEFYRSENWLADYSKFARYDFARSGMVFSDGELVNLTAYMGTQVYTKSKFNSLLSFATKGVQNLPAPSYELLFNLGLNFYKKNQLDLAKQTLERMDRGELLTRNPLVWVATLAKSGEFGLLVDILQQNAAGQERVRGFLVTILRVISPAIVEHRGTDFERILQFKASRFPDGDMDIDVEFANFLRKSNRIAEAEAILTTVVKDPNAPGKANEVYAQLLMQTDRAADALGELKKAVAKNPDNTDSREKLHDLYYDRRDYFSARTQSLRLTELAPGRPDYIMLLGKDELKTGNVAEAVKLFQLAIEKSGGNWPDPWVRLAESQLALGQMDAAILSAQDALKIAPDEPDAYMMLSKIYSALKDSKKSLSILVQGAKANPTKEAFWKRLGDAYLENKNITQAKAAYGKAVELDPTYVNALASLAEIEFEDGNFAKAIEYYTRAVAERPTSAKLIFERARSYDRINRYDEAVADYQKSFELSDSENTVFRAKILRRISGGFRKLGKLKEALGAAEQSIELDSEEYFGHLEKVDSLIALENFEGAKESLLTALKLNSKSCAVLRRAKKLQIKTDGDFSKCKSIDANGGGE